jgi:dynein heavy chain
LSFSFLSLFSVSLFCFSLSLSGELYGEFNQLTNEWKDGIVPKLVRDCVNALNEGIENRKWIIFDGPVDAVWIENMNTVLDDNKTLCLANSERIKLPSTLHMLFEVQDLKVASPATVSRCGMVYMEQIHIGMLSLVKSWGQTTGKNLVGVKNAKIITSFVEIHLESAIDYLRNECIEKVKEFFFSFVSFCVIFSLSLFYFFLSLSLLTIRFPSSLFPCLSLLASRFALFLFLSFIRWSIHPLGCNF